MIKTMKTNKSTKNGGVIAEVNEALNTLLDKIEALEERLETCPAC